MKKDLPDFLLSNSKWKNTIKVSNFLFGLEKLTNIARKETSIYIVGEVIDNVT